MPTTKTPLPLGATISCPAGTATVSVTHIRLGVYRVETTTGGFINEGWTKSYDDETMARMAATRAVQVLREWGSVANIDRLRDETVATLKEAERRQRHGHRTSDVIEACTAILDSITDLDGLALINDIRATLAAA